MTNEDNAGPRQITVGAEPITLSQFLKFGGLAESGGAAKHAIRDGRVTVNGAVETQKGKKLSAGDRITFEGRTIVVHFG